MNHYVSGNVIFFFFKQVSEEVAAQSFSEGISLITLGKQGSEVRGNVMSAAVNLALIVTRYLRENCLWL